MEREPSEREALRKKAELERAALRQGAEDDDGIHVIGKPKFAPPVKSQKQDIFGEKLKSSLGEFEKVAPLLQELHSKHRPIYGVAACPQTPVSNTLNKPTFSLDIADPQPSTSACGQDNIDSGKRNGAFLPPTSSSSSNRREKNVQNGYSESNGRQRSPSNDNGADRNRKPRVNGEWDHGDRGGRSSKNDRHDDRYSGHDKHYRRGEESIDSRAPSSKKDQRDSGYSSCGQSRRSDHQSANNHRSSGEDNAGETSSRKRNQAESREDSSNTDKRSSSSAQLSAANDSGSQQFRRGDERHRTQSEKMPAPPSKSSSSVRSETSGKDKVINRHDRDKSDQQRQVDRYSDKMKNGSAAMDRSSSTTQSKPIDQSIRRHSHSRSPAPKAKANDAGDKSIVQKREQSECADSKGAKKHGQSSLRLEGLSTFRQKDATNGSDSIPSTPSIEKMIKKVTGIVEAPPLSGIPAADPTDSPFSYPIKADESVAKVSTIECKTSAADSAKRHKVASDRRIEAVSESPSSSAVHENGVGKRSTLEDELWMSDSDADDSDSDSAISDKEETPKPRPKADEHSIMNSKVPEKYQKERANSESPKKEERKQAPNRSFLESSPIKNDSKPQQSEFTWSISSLLNAMTPTDTKTPPPPSSSQCISGPSTSTGAPSPTTTNRSSSKQSKRDKTSNSRTTNQDGGNRNSEWERSRHRKDDNAMDEGSDGESHATGSYGMDTGAKQSTSNDDPKRPPKISLKLKNGKVQRMDHQEKGRVVEDEEKRADRAKTTKRNMSPYRKEEEKAKKSKDNQGTMMETVERVAAATEETGNTGKENMKWAEANGAKSKTKLNLPNGKIYETDAETILQESRLSPLLSPIHEFPPLEFVNGKPSLLCQIPLNMLQRVPSQKRQGDRTTGQQRGEENLCKSSASPKPKSAPEEKKAVAASTSSGHDLDDVPILERIDSKKRKSVTGPSATAVAVSAQKEDPPREEKVKPTTGVEKAKFRGGKNSSGKPPVQSAPTKVQTTEKKSKAGSKRKTVDDCPQLETSSTSSSPPRKAPRLEQDVSLILADAPTKKIELDLDCAKEQQYQTKAKDVKHDADSQADKTLRILLYLESVVYFLMTGLCMEKMLSKRNKESSTPHTMIKTTVDLLKSVAQKYVGQMSSASNIAGYVSKVDILSLRIQSLCYYKMFEMRQPQAINNYRQLNEFHKTADRASSSAPSSVNHPSSNGSQVQNGGQSGGDGNSGVTPSPTPSPASSTGSSHSLPPGQVAIPQHIDMLYRQQLSHLHSLMWAHYHWQQAEQKLQGDKSTEDKAFFDYLNDLCGALTLTSDLHDLCSYVLTAVTWLRQMYAKRHR